MIRPLVGWPGPVLLLFLAAGLLPARPVDPADIDNLMKESLQNWQVPGAALAIVQGDRLVFLKGFGARHLGKSERVTPDTVFPIASCSKSFTTLAMAMLVDEGKMGWDDPVRKHVDFFHLADPLADANVTLRDLVCHRTGVGPHTLLWYHAPWGLEERIRKIGLVKPQFSFRSTFEYQSILFGTAGYAVGKAGGGSWQEFVQRRIALPLGMKATSFTTGPAQKAADHASPHRQNRQGKIEPISWYPISEPDPAGSINSSARDLANFLRFQLGDGTWQGKRLVSAGNLHETQRPQIVFPLEGYARDMNPETQFLCYGMGWIVQDYRGQLLLMHGGVIDGFRAHFTLLPHAGLGFVLLNNLHRTQMNLAVSNMLIDQFLDLPYKDWNAYYQNMQKLEEKQTKAKVRRLRERRHKGTKPTLPLKAYCGTYTDPAYGQARVSLEDGALVLHWARLRCSLEHYHYDTFLTHNDLVEMLDTPVVFVLGSDGEVETMRALERDFKRHGRKETNKEKKIEE